MSPVDLVLVEGYKRDAFPKLEIHRAANGKPLIHPQDPHIIAIASDVALPPATVPVVDLDDVEAIADLLLKHAVPVDAAEADSASRVMAQLTDDCFAFSGPLLRLDDMERLIGERIAPVAETERVSLREARAAASPPSDVIAPVDLPPFDNSAVDGYAVRHADLAGEGDTRLAIAGRLTAGASARLAAEVPGEAIRIFTGAAMPAGADTVFMQEDVHARRRSRDRAAGPEARRQPPARRRGRAHRSCRAARRHRARGAAHRARRRARHHHVRGAPPAQGGDLLHRRRGGRAGHAARRRRHLRRQPLSARRAARPARRRGHRSRHSRATSRRRLRARSPPPRPATIWC